MTGKIPYDIYSELNEITFDKKIRLMQSPKLHCQCCNREIPYDEKYVKDNLLYVTSDWTKCLC